MCIFIGMNAKEIESLIKLLDDPDTEISSHVTEKIKAGGKLLDITLLDHIIVTEEGYFSFADEGLL